MPKSTDKLTVVTSSVLREWALPAVGDSKYGRGEVVVIGGSERAPGAAMLAGIAALRVGAGRLTLGVASSVAPHVAVALPESGVVALSLASLDPIADDLGSADVLVLGPGLDDVHEAEALVRQVPDLLRDDSVLLLDAFGLGVLPGLPEVSERLAGRLVLTPNTGEAARLLGRDLGDDLPGDIVAIAERYNAVVSCQGEIADATGSRWSVGAGGPGLGTSGSGDVLAGAIAGLVARGATPAQGTVWATHVHAAAGERLAVRVAPLGYLASEILTELPRVLVEIET